MCPARLYKHLTRSPEMSYGPIIELTMVWMRLPNWNCCRGWSGEVSAVEPRPLDQCRGNCCYSSSSLYSSFVESSVSLLPFPSKGSSSSWLLVLICLKVGPLSNGKGHKTDIVSIQTSSGLLVT